MILNPNKFELLQLKPNTTNNTLNTLQVLPFSENFSHYVLSDNSIIEPSEYVRDLGIFIDRKLDWKVHIFNICKKSRRTSGWVLNTFFTREREPMFTIYKTLIRPILEYNCEIWNPYKITDIIQIEKIQRTFTYKITGVQDLNYWERLTNLKLLSLQRRREKIILTIIWKIKNNILPNSINLLFREHDRLRATRAILPPLPKTNSGLTTKYENSFAVRGARLWNSLPPPLTRITQMNVFKSALDKYLCEIPDNPPLPGYYTANSNSIIDWAVNRGVEN